MNTEYSADEPTRAEVDQIPGATVVEFGTSWCGHCRAAQPLMAPAFADYPDLRHIKVEDGSGKLLGRTFEVKLWPTLIFLRDGVELARLVRPQQTAAIGAALARIHATTGAQ